MGYGRTQCGTVSSQQKGHQPLAVHQDDRVTIEEHSKVPRNENDRCWPIDELHDDMFTRQITSWDGMQISKTALFHSHKVMNTNICSRTLIVQDNSKSCCLTLCGYEGTDPAARRGYLLCGS